ncbi:hypothetical protein OG455_41440 [Kitasatospora sp. NBC_01287]|nr:hypothetical protein [Kitasatospora sp. NBC_01287]MCX4750948.1 hypothetical protein [Kitasatospora sp. NBC_01287]MCX4751801.1 hypothetical protein [Kitasatospora sp. NBC_01287]MCX4751907.1 hypothetical protein [Kitasatospora sp. NBC_01287]
MPAEDEWTSPEYAELVARYRKAQQEAKERGEDPRLSWFLRAPAE